MYRTACKEAPVQPRAFNSLAPEVIALGMYAPSCDDVARFIRSCLGCESSPTLRVVAMLDVVEHWLSRQRSRSLCVEASGKLNGTRPRRAKSSALRVPGGRSGTGATPCCLAADHAVLAASLLDAATISLWRNGTRINFMKTRALFQLMIDRVPAARWLCKVDSDAVLNVIHLRQLL